MVRLALVLIAVFVTAAPVAAAQTPPPAPTPTGTGTTPSDVDSDGDSWPDSIDECPATWGTARGCPDADRDRDGFPNETDMCPDISGQAKGCPGDPNAVTPPPTRTQRVAATSISAPNAAISKHGRGWQFDGSVRANGLMTPRRLTIWLPKGLKVSGAPAKPCTEAFARRMDLDNEERCAEIFAGRLNDEHIRSYRAYAGPKVGRRQRLWLRAHGDEDLVGFGTGWIEPATGAFATKLTLELGSLSLKTTIVELYSGAERSTAGMVRPLQGKCSGKFKVRLDTAQGAAEKTFAC